MYTQCPYCQTLFQISTDQLLTANGKAHCCRCDRIFNARENLRESTSDGTTPIGPGDTNARVAPDPLTDQQRSDTAPADETPSAAPGDHSREEPLVQDIDQATEQISVSHLFEQLQHDDKLSGIPEAVTDEQQPSALIPSLEIEPFLLDPDQGPFPVYDEEEIAGSIPDLGDIDQEERNDPIPTYLLDPSAPEEIGPVSRQSEPDAPSEPVFGTEFVSSQLDQAESLPLSTEPSDITEVLPAVQDTDSIADRDTSLEFGELLQEIEPLENGSESHHSEHTLAEDETEPAFQIPENLPAIEPTAGESLYSEEMLTIPDRGKRHNLAWSLAVLVLLLLAVGQAAWLGRDRLMNYPAGRELLDSFCQLTGCQLPERRAPDQIEILNRSVASHPQTPNALQILLTLSNQARFQQPYPQIQLSLFNTKDELLARRRFQPEEYLEQVAGSYPLLRPQQPVQLEILLHDPGGEATGFKFDFF